MQRRAKIHRHFINMLPPYVNNRPRMISNCATSKWCSKRYSLSQKNEDNSLKNGEKYWATTKEIDTFNVVLKRNY